MSEPDSTDINQRSAPADGSRKLTNSRLQAYLTARETMRRLKMSPTPCFARDWRPKMPASPER